MSSSNASNAGQQSNTTVSDKTSHLRNFPVIELRRYIVQPEEREHFARYYESYFPEAFEQLGAIIFGHFCERQDQRRFTWIRGFHNMEARATVNQAFYSGPVWKEHSTTMNDRLIDHTDVLLLQPLRPESEIPVLPAVDPIHEKAGAQGVVVAQIFAVKADSVETFAQQAGEAFASYRAAGAHEAGVLVTLDAPNNFPSLPFRTDGPYLVWLGILRDHQQVQQQFLPLAERIATALVGTGLLRGETEIVIMDPTSRSRLRWLPE